MYLYHLWVPNTPTRNPDVFPGPSFLFFLTGIYFSKWNGQYLGEYIIHKTERERKTTSCILLCYFIWGKMFYARPSESKIQSYYSTHSCFNHFSTNNGEKMWFYKQTGRKAWTHPGSMFKELIYVSCWVLHLQFKQNQLGCPKESGLLGIKESQEAM